MTEVLFILTTIFVAYVVYVIVGDTKSAKADKKPSPAQAKKPEPKKPSAPKPAVKAAAAEKTTPAKKTTSRSKPKPTAVASTAANELRNPENGEVSKIASNYRFIKRWIKDALVSEGLLDQVYKNNAIDDAAEAKIDAALEKIKTLDKYKV
jgi:ABC-type uncharacterized transport system involved in gliding motility auxiliary subunit